MLLTYLHNTTHQIICQYDDTTHKLSVCVVQHVTNISTQHNTTHQIICQYNDTTNKPSMCVVQHVTNISTQHNTSDNKCQYDDTMIFMDKQN